MDNILIVQIDGVYRIEALGVVIEAPNMTIRTVTGTDYYYDDDGLCVIDDINIDRRVRRHEQSI